MIFERQVYRKINFISAMFKKYALFSLPKIKESYLSIESLYPASIKDIEISKIESLNQKCHSNAFVIMNKKISIELSKCNSCMECKNSEGIIFSKIDQISRIIEDKYLPLDR